MTRLAELSGNKWVKTFTAFLKDLIKEKKKIQYDKVILKAMEDYGVKQSTTDKYLSILQNAGVIEIKANNTDGSEVKYIIIYKGE